MRFDALSGDYPSYEPLIEWEYKYLLDIEALSLEPESNLRLVCEHEPGAGMFIAYASPVMCAFLQPYIEQLEQWRADRYGNERPLVPLVKHEGHWQFSAAGAYSDFPEVDFQTAQRELHASISELVGRSGRTGLG